MATSPEEEQQQQRFEAIDSAIVFVTQRYREPLTASEKIQVIQAWNKASEAGSDGAFGQALVLEWRLLSAEHDIDLSDSNNDSNNKNLYAYPFRGTTQTQITSARARRRTSNRREAMRLVERNKDPLYSALDARMYDAPHLLMGLLDGALRRGFGSTHVEHNLRSGPRPVEEEIHLLKHKRSVDSATTLKLECETVADYLQLFARCGVQPRHWLTFSDAFKWAIETYVLQVQEQQSYNQFRSSSSSPFARAAAQTVVLPALKDIREIKSLAAEPAFRQVLPRFWSRLSSNEKASFGELFYRRLLTKNPSLLEFFARTDMDSLSVHLMMSLDLVVKSVEDLGSDSTSPFRAALNHLGEMHRKVGVPTYSYALVGGMLIQCLQPLFQAEEQLLTKNLQKRTRFAGSSIHRINGPSTSINTRFENGTGKRTKPKEGKPSFVSALRSCCWQASLEENEKPVSDRTAPIKQQKMLERSDSEVDGGSSSATTKDMTAVFTRLYVEVMSIVYYPMLKQEKLVDSGKQFYEVVKAELQWSEDRFKKRISEVEHEIQQTGTYHQTTEEIAVGAKCAWRNSAKCPGRESWDTLVIRDSRHIDHPQKIFEDVQEHMQMVVAGADVRPVMTIYRPKQPNEAIGARFWSSRVGSYAAYRDEESDALVGDPENLELTNYLVQRSLWNPPEHRSSFDLLPIVFKVPGKSTPNVYPLPSESVQQIAIEHPNRPEIAGLGYKWPVSHTVSDFKLTLGGIVYENITFSRWYVSSEIVRFLIQRHNALEECAEALSLDRKRDPLFQQRIEYELECAVLYSFRKNGLTIEDPKSMAESFSAHTQREQLEFGRECPWQWSPLTSTIGPLQSSLDCGMRDFLASPRFEASASGFLLELSTENEGRPDDVADGSETASVSTGSALDDTPRPLIVFGSETGTAEAVARKLQIELSLLRPLLMSLNNAADPEELAKYNVSHILAICSTFADGQAPANAAKFFESDCKLAKVASIKFAVLALGSSLYPKFCNAGVILDKKLLDAGMEKMCSLEKADSASDGFDTIAEWKRMVHQILLPPHLEKELSESRGTSLDDPPVNVFKWTPMESFIDETCVEAICLSNTEFLDEDRTRLERSIRNIKFALPDGSEYETGDHLAVKPRNNEGCVNRFLTCFTLELAAEARALRPSLDCSDREALEWIVRRPFELEVVDDEDRSASDVFFETPTTLFRVLTDHLDLSLDTRRAPLLLHFLKLSLDRLSEDLTSTEAGKLAEHPLYKEFMAIATPVLKRDEKAEYLLQEFVASFPTVFLFFEYFQGLFCDEFTQACFGWRNSEPTVKLAELLIILPAMQNRFYSISSSSRASPHEVSISVGVLQKRTQKGVLINGTCSNYLAALRPATDSARISVRKSTFRLSGDDAAPIIMVAAGTGISPMIGFLRDRALSFEASGRDCNMFKPIHLFFGCRTEHDFIFENEIRKYAENGMIILHLALSRSTTTSKKYVQDKLLEMGEAACHLLLDPKLQYYVCGDARMAEGCFTACVDILRRYSATSRVLAVQHLKTMRLEGRWQSDVWGIVSHYDSAQKEVARDKLMAAKVWLSYFANPSGSDREEDFESGMED